MNKIIVLYDLPDNPDNPNGLTIREANLQKNHNIPIGSLVEVKYDIWFGDSACAKIHARLWIIDHSRDCDGTPLYTLADKPRETLEHFGIDFTQPYGFKASTFCDILTSGHSEESLTIIERTIGSDRGEDSLSWE